MTLAETLRNLPNCTRLCWCPQCGRIWNRDTHFVIATGNDMECRGPVQAGSPTDCEKSMFKQGTQKDD